MADTRSYCVKGVDHTAKVCSVCGGHPIVASSGCTGKMKGNGVFMAYYHCPCNERVTDWRFGDTRQAAIDAAREAWQKDELL